MKTNWKSLPVVTMALLCALSGHAPVAHAKRSKDNTVTGVVTKVSDGDTLWVRPDRCETPGECRPLKIRIQGIDAPETCQASGAQSAEALRARLLNQTVEMTLSSQDVYGRELGRVRLEGEDVGAWMVRQGLAWSYRYKHGAGPYAEEEQQARKARRGVFADSAAVEPRAFRKAHGPCQHR
jgi:micrococcal nuclease